MTSSPLVSRANMDILDELQLITAQNLERLEVNKYYEVIRELGKGTYGKVDLVIHKIRGEELLLSISSTVIANLFPLFFFIPPSLKKKRDKNGAEVPEEEDHQAEVVPAGVQHFAVPVSVPVHHQHVWDRLRDGRVLRVCAGVRARRRPL